MLTDRKALTEDEAKKISRDRNQALAQAQSEVKEKETHFKFLQERAKRIKQQIQEESAKFLERLQSAESSMQFSKTDLSKDVYDTVFTKGVFARHQKKKKKTTKVRTALFEGESEEKPVHSYLYDSQPENILDHFKQNITITRDRLIKKIDEKLEQITAETGTSAILKHSFEQDFLPKKIATAEEWVDILKSEVVNAIRRAAEEYYVKQKNWETNNKAHKRMLAKFGNVSWVGINYKFDIHQAVSKRWNWDLIETTKRESIPQFDAKIDDIIKGNSLTECCRQFNQSMSACVKSKGVSSEAEELLQKELQKLSERYPAELGIEKTKDGSFIKLLQPEETLNLSTVKQVVAEKSLKKEGSLKEESGEILFEVQSEHTSAFEKIHRDLGKIEKRARALDDKLTRASREKVGSAVIIGESLTKLQHHHQSLQEKSQKVKATYDTGLSSLRSTHQTNAEQEIKSQLKDMTDALTKDVQPLLSRTERDVKALPDDGADSKFQAHPDLRNTLESSATPIKIKSLKERYDDFKEKFKELKSTIQFLSLLPNKIISFKEIVQKQNAIKEKMNAAEKAGLELKAAKEAFERIDQSFGKLSDEKPEALITKAQEQLQLAIAAKDKLVRLQGDVNQLGSFDYPDFLAESKAMQDEVENLNKWVTEADVTVKSLQEKNARFPEFVRIIEARTTADKAMSDARKAQASHQTINADLKQEIVSLREKVKEEKAKETIDLLEVKVQEQQRAAETAGRQYSIFYQVADGAVGTMKSFMDMTSGFFQNNFLAEYNRVQWVLNELKKAHGEKTLPTENVSAEIPSLKAYHDFLLAVNAAEQSANIYREKNRQIMVDLKEMDGYVKSANTKEVEKLANKIQAEEKELNTQSTTLKKQLELAEKLLQKYSFDKSEDLDYQQTVSRYNQLKPGQFPEVNYDERLREFRNDAAANRRKISNAEEYLELMHQVYLLNMPYFQEQVAWKNVFGGVPHEILENRERKTYKLAAGNKQQLDITTEFSVKKERKETVNAVESVRLFKQAALDRLAVAENNKWYQKNNYKYEINCLNVRSPETKDWYTFTGGVNPENIDIDKTYDELEKKQLKLPSRREMQQRRFMRNS